MEKELTNLHILSNVVENDFVSASDLCFRRERGKYLKSDEYGKTYFLVYQGKLRQFRFVKTIVFPFTWGIKKKGSLGNYFNVTVIDVAGVGRLNVGCFMYYGELNFPIYESIEDYKNDKPHKPGYYTINKECNEKRYGVKLVCKNCKINSNESLYRWYWNGTCAELRLVNDCIPICFVCEADGIHFPDGWSKKSLSGYATKEECEADNEISVCCFDGEEPKQQAVEKIIRLSVEIKESDLARLKEFVKVVD